MNLKCAIVDDEPLALDLLESYVQILQLPATPSENVKKVCDSVENALPLMADAFEKQIDSLYGADALDITADVEVLKTMIEQGQVPEPVRVYTRLICRASTAVE